MTTLMKVLIALAVVAGVSYACISLTQASDAKVIQEAQQKEAAAEAQAAELAKERDTLKAQADALADKANEWQEKAVAATNQAAALDKQVAAAQAKLAKLPATKPAVDVASLPADQVGLIADYKQAGFAADPLQNGGLGFGIGDARSMMALIQDGQAYPAAVEKIQDFTDQNTIMAAETVQLKAANEAQAQEGNTLRQENTARAQAEQKCEEQVAALQGAVADEKTVVQAQASQIHGEKAKKWFWGGAGVVIGWFVRVAWVAL